MMLKIKTYDLPTRLFHWLFAISFISAFLIAKVVDDETANYAYHMILGMFMSALVIMRIMWGIVGSKYARFSSLDLNPKNLIQYFKDMTKGNHQQVIGHNPASSWLAVIMMKLSLLMVITGYLMIVRYNKHFFEEVHGFMATVFVILAIAHIAGIALHTYKLKDSIGFSMIHGNKNLSVAQKSDGIEHSYNIAGVIYLTLAIIVAGFLLTSFDKKTATIHFFSKSFVLVKLEK